MSEEQKQFGYVEYLWREEEANKLSGVCYRSNVSQSCEKQLLLQDAEGCCR